MSLPIYTNKAPALIRVELVQIQCPGRPLTDRRGAPIIYVGEPVWRPGVRLVFRTAGGSYSESTYHPQRGD